MEKSKESDGASRMAAKKRLKSQVNPEEEISVEQARSLIHELRIHQIELEMQNEELRRSQAQLDESRHRYADLYDFAPVGYLTFDHEGLIVEANLTAAKQLGEERARFLKKPFFLYVIKADRDAFRLHLAKVFDTAKPQTHELKLKPGAGEEFYARLESLFIEDANGKRFARTSISDISCSRHAEEVLQRAHDELEERVAARTAELSIANEQLRHEMEERRLGETQTRAVNALLKLLNEVSSSKEYLDDVLQEIQRQSGCCCIGIRMLHEKGLVSYESHMGFSREFLEAESRLSLERDCCVCTRIIAEQTEPIDYPYLTEAGVFLCNDTTELAARLTEKEQSKFRGSCIRHGFRSVAVIPVRHGGKMVGAIHLADKRENMIPLKQVEFIESLAKLIGAAIHKFTIQERLQQNYDKQNAVNSLLRLSIEEVSIDELLGRSLDTLLSIPWLSLESKGSVYLVENGFGALVLKAQRGMTGEREGSCHQNLYEKGVSERTMITREIQLLRCPDSHNELLSGSLPHSHYSIPILCSGSVLGMIDLRVNVDHFQDQKELEFLTAVANTLSGIIQRKQSVEALRESEKQLRILSSQLLKAQEEERKRIACELHDSIGSSLSAIKFSIENTCKQFEQDGAACQSLNNLIGVAQHAIDESRRIMTDLRPSILDDLGIVVTIGWFCRRSRSIYSDIHIEQQIDIQEHEIPEPLKIVIFRVMQEGFNNIFKYSKADLVEIALMRRGGSIELTIEDNGAGFDVGAILAGEGHRKGLGLISMKERTELSGGTFTIESLPGEGTTIRASWSYGDE
jgi:PAS domain S-box-containing protein